MSPSILQHAAAENGGLMAASWVSFQILKLERFIEKTLPMARRVERQNLRLTYAIQGGPAAPEIFRAAEAARAECGVDEYGVAQGSLEQIFNLFAAQQDEEATKVMGVGGGAALPAEPTRPPPPPLDGWGRPVPAASPAEPASASWRNPLSGAPSPRGEAQPDIC